MPNKKRGGSKAATAPDNSPQVPGGDYIVFGDNKKNKKAKDKSVSNDALGETGPPKPNARQVIGGASWTGKLPVNMLSEHCQKQKWNKPEYSMRQQSSKDGGAMMYRSMVTLSKSDSKTRETTTLPPFRLPDSAAELGDEPSALEARHFAATYALFRISSMKNIHMMLPPKFRDLWKGEFAQMKKEDEKDGRAWKYDADPFAAQEKREHIRATMEKRQQEQEAQRLKETNNPSVVLARPKKGRAWDQAPKLELGSKIRTEIEDLVRRNAIWNPHDLKLSHKARKEIVEAVTKLGFRQSHVEEAMEYCKDEEEILEWLIVHVPEDDLPQFALPAGYNTGVTLSSGDLIREAKIKRLSAGGYEKEQCIEALNAGNGDEHSAARLLQGRLIGNIQLSTSTTAGTDSSWEEEMIALDAIMEDRYERVNSNECQLTIDTENEPRVLMRVIKPSEGYPHTLPTVILLCKELPAYIRLSLTKKLLQYASEELVGEVMLFNICEWIASNLSETMRDPGRLIDLRTHKKESIAKQTIENQAFGRVRHARNKVLDTRDDTIICELWAQRQASSAQKKMLSERQRLPAWAKQQDILHAIAQKQVSIISGETGSGKSTQAVQFVLDTAISNLKGAKTNIVCTQPRRIAALSLAERVADERCSVVGSEIGYIIRGESKTSKETKITFMTTGVLLRRLQVSNSTSEALEGISHVFVDEVHERTLDTDFLLALLREALNTNSELKIVLMSATLDAEAFTDYFGGHSKVSNVEIQGRTHPVSDHYLDEVLQLVKPNTVTPADDTEQDIGKTIQMLGAGINYDLIVGLLHAIDENLGDARGSILIFLPGIMEIERCIRSLSSESRFTGLPLHASLLPSEQRKVFPPAPYGKRKVIAATNVAETSITIEDIVAVIDTGRVKETKYDVSNNIVRLQETWASQAACKQRRGRAGRVRAGHCYKLFTRNIEQKMLAKPLPEIKRVPLEQLCLSVKAIDEARDIAQFLGQTLTPPESGAVTRAIELLHDMGALEDNRLTALGTYLSMIPADLRCAKLLVYGTLFGCLEACLTLASILTTRSPFVSPRDKRDEAKMARSAFSNSGGDLLLELAAYEEYIEMSEQSPVREVRSWCEKNFLSLQTLRDITSTRLQLLDALKDVNLVPLDYKNGYTTVKTSQLLLRALIAASLNPQMAQISFPDKKYMQSHTGAKELDPEAKAIKYFIPSDNSSAGENRPMMDRVFVHPSSVLFDAQSYSGAANYLSYFSKMATGTNPKTFIRELTPLNAYSLLLFGGDIQVDTSGAGLSVGKTFHMRGWARIGVLASRLRALLDQELRMAVDQPNVSFAHSKVVGVVKKLVELNGQDQ